MSRRVGDYHIADVAMRVGRDGISHFHAFCDHCGWQGPNRPNKAAAEDDEYAHDVAENPGR